MCGEEEWAGEEGCPGFGGCVLFHGEWGWFVFWWEGIVVCVGCFFGLCLCLFFLFRILFRHVRVSAHNFYQSTETLLLCVYPSWNKGSACKRENNDNSRGFSNRKAERVFHEFQ